MHYKGYKIRLYPTKEQENLIWQHIGACRFIWNYMLDLQIKGHENGAKHLRRFDMIKLLTSLKTEDEYVWLKNVSNTSLQRTCSDLSLAYDNFFKKSSGFPKFKSRKHSKPSFPVRSEYVYFDGNYVFIQKIGKVKFKTDFSFPEKKRNVFIDVRISFIDGKYILSFTMECENQAPELSNKVMGIDLGIKELAVVSYGNERLVFHNINKSKKIRYLKQKLIHVQRTISRKYEASIKRTGEYEKTKNIERAEQKARKIYTKISNIRLDYLHQTTHKLTSMLPHAVVMEKLNITDMMKNKHLSKLIAEQCFYEFIRQMQYKCEWNQIMFIQADKFYPSSKMCSCCGFIKYDLKLSDRMYACSKCGFTIDRDYNAAINLMRYADLHTQSTA